MVKRNTKNKLRANRTLNSVQLALGRIPRQSNQLSGFLGCRYDPFMTMSNKAMIPDGKGRNILPGDFKRNIDLVITGNTSIRIRPWFPYPVSIFSNNTVLANGFNLSCNISAGPLNIGATPNMGQFSELYPGWNTIDTRYQATSARYVTIGYRLTYTGTAQSAQGVITVTKLPWSAEPSINNASNVISYNSTGGNNVVPAVTALIFRYDGTNIGAIPTQEDQMVVRPEEGAKGVLAMSVTSDAHPYTPWFEASVAPISDSILPNAANYNLMGGEAASPTSAALYAGLNFYDPAFSEVDINISAGGSYRLEIIGCVEMQLAANSVSIPFAAPTSNLNKLKLAADDALNQATKSASPLNGSLLQIPASQVVKDALSQAKAMAQTLQEVPGLNMKSNNNNKSTSKAPQPKGRLTTTTTTIVTKPKKGGR